MNDLEPQPVLSLIEPVLAVNDIVETIRYWQNVLAFPNKWAYGDPPNHGGVSWNDVSLQFSQNPDQAKKFSGSVVWIKVKNIDLLYRIHQERKADIVDELQKRPWGLDDYWVKDINGYYIIFAGNSLIREKSGSFPEGVQIIDKKPTVDEYRMLLMSVGWFDRVGRDRLADRLAGLAYSAVAIDTNTDEIIGCAFLLSDNASFYYVKDVIVKPEWQKKRVGTALMKAVSNWLDTNGIPKSLVGLYTAEGLEQFYKQFGFGKAFGMTKNI